MKKLLQLSIFLCSIVSFGQAPVVNNPILNLAADNTLTISCAITPNGTVSSYEVIYSEDAFFTPNVTHSFSIFSTLTGSTSQTVTTDVLCLNSADNYYIKVKANNENGTTTSGYTTMTTTGNAFNNLPKVNTLNFSNTTSNSATLNVNVDNNLNVTTTTYVEYGLSTTNLAFYSALPSTNTDNAIASVNLSGLSANTTYYFRISLSNSVGCTKSAFYQLTTPMPVTLLYHFPFNGNRNAIVGTGSFTSATGSGTFVNDGLGNSSGALEVNTVDNFSSQALSASLVNLPQANTSRSIVMRIRFNTAAMTHYVVSWGAPSNNNSYGFEKTSNQSCSSVWGNNKCFPDQTFANLWGTYAITWDGTNGTALYYKNGALVNSGQNQGNVNTTATNIRLGTSLATNFGDANFWIDDLKIYSGVLTSAQIATLSSSDFNTNNLTIAMYPNPVNDILNINFENEIKSIEIYSLQGQKVITTTSKQVNVSHLSNGVYIVRVEDENGAIATKKLIKY